MYLTYSEYVNMGGTLEPPIFEDLEFEAESIINWYTFNRLQKETTYSDTVKRVMMKVIQLMGKKHQALGVNDNSSSNEQVSGTVASQSNDGFSTTYNVLSASEMLKTSEDEIEGIINRYLQFEVNSLGQKLLYRGIYPNE